MFYSHDILHRRSGKFGIVWLAATKFTSVSLSKREYFEVSVSTTCDDIMKYICLQAQPLKPHGARPRLSLYLSSQLMFGVTRVYKKQMDYLVAEVLELFKRFHSTKLVASLTSDKKDFMQVAVQKQYRTGEFCTLDDLLRDSDDSAFGVMKFLEGREIDPSLLPHIDFLPEESFPPGFPRRSPPRPPPGSSPPGSSPPGSSPGFPPDEPFSPPKMGDVRMPHTVSSASEISLKEFPKLPELPTLDDDDLMPVEEPGEFIEQMERAARDSTFEQDEGYLRPEEHPPVPSSPRERETRREKKPTEKRTAAVAPPDQVTVGSPLREPPVIPPEPVTPTAPTPIPALHLSPLDELPEVSSSPRRHGRRRQLSFHDVVDDYTQLSKQYIRNNMATSNDSCYSSVNECIASVPRLTTAELLQLPGRRSLTKSKTMMDMWKKRAVRFKGRVVPSEDDDGEPWSTQYLRVKPDVSSTTETSPEVPTGSPEKMRALVGESAEKRPGLDETEQSLLSASDISRLSESRESIQHPSLTLDPSALRPKRLTEQSIKEERDIGPVDQLEQSFPVGLPSDVVPGPPVSPVGELPEIAETPPEELQELAETPPEELPEIAVAPPEELPVFAEAAKSPEISTSEEEQTIIIPHQNIIRRIAELTSVEETITFKDLVPLTSSCSVAGKVFSVCLEYAALKLILLQQTIPYGDIYIKRGELF